MTLYRKGLSNDQEAIIHLGNYVFDTDFPALLPKLYSPSVNTATSHFLAEEEDGIKALVGSFPLDLHVLDYDLKGFGIGTVCVDPDARSKGHMKQLMTNALAEMHEEKADFAVLGGQKQRYEYFGFTPSGTHLNFTLTATNLRHHHIVASPNFTFKSFDTLDTPTLSCIHKMHHSKPLFSTRSFQNFISICRSWKSESFAIYNKNELCGYVLYKNNCIEDFYVSHSDLLIPALASLMQTLSWNECTICLNTYETALIKLLINICEGYTTRLSTCLNILNYQNFINAFLNLKKSYTALEKGHLVLEVQGTENLLIEVGENINVMPTTLEADLSLTHLEAIHLLCDPLQVYIDYHHEKNRLIKSWFPLPFAFCSIDNV